MAGFTFAYRQSGGAPTIQEFVFKDSETLTKGDLVNIESGQADLAATNDTGLAGVALETVAGTTGVSTIRVITDQDAVYSVVDANARENGATLDITGTTGAQTVTTSSNVDVQVVAKSSATEPTLVKINHVDHYQVP
jgi:hypothetical protein